jgi:hypothetical protein
VTGRRKKPNVAFGSGGVFGMLVKTHPGHKLPPVAGVLVDQDRRLATSNPLMFGFTKWNPMPGTSS